MKFYIINPVDGSNATKCDSFKDLKKVHKIPDSDWDTIITIFIVSLKPTLIVFLMQ